MGPAVRQTARRVAAYALDVTLLATLLIPIAFGLQLLLGYRPTTGAGIWLASLVTISLPTWAYFTLSDASTTGATLGKRALGVRASFVNGRRITIGSAFVRTVIKLVPWELTHVALFGISVELGIFSGLQIGLLWLVYALLALYLVVALRTAGERSVHDLVAGTAVRRAVS
jgi:uncharacterized RDD family membrane protein YckC